MHKVKRNNVEDIVYLSPIQKAMLVHYLKNPLSDIYFEQLVFNMTGKLDIETFKKSWEIICNKNEMLRTIFRWETFEEPIQIILKHQEVNIIVHDISEERLDDKDKLIQSIKNEDRKKKFDLNQVPFRITICKVENEKYIMVITNHHIIYDGWSNGIILTEFFTIYNSIYSHKNFILKPRNKYKEFIKFLYGKRSEENKRFWDRYLDGVKNKGEVDINHDLSELKEIDNYVINFKEFNSDQIFEFIKDNNITLAIFFYAVWAIILNKYKDEKDVIFGTTVSGRNVPIENIENMVGLFINTIPFRIKIDGEKQFWDLLDEIKNDLYMIGEYSNISLVDISSYCKINLANFIDSIVVIENYPINVEKLNENSILKIDSYEMFISAEFDLILNISIISGIEVTLCYNKKMYNKYLVENVAKDFEIILKAILNSCEDKLLTIKNIQMALDDTNKHEEKILNDIEIEFEL